MVWGLRFKVWDLGFKVYCFRCRVKALRFQALNVCGLRRTSAFWTQMTDRTWGLLKNRHPRTPQGQMGVSLRSDIGDSSGKLLPQP